MKAGAFYWETFVTALIQNLSVEAAKEINWGLKKHFLQSRILKRQNSESLRMKAVDKLIPDGSLAVLALNH